MATDFTNDAQDCLAEFCNIAVKRAGATLSEMINQEIFLSIPKCEVMNRQKISHYLREQNDEISCIITIEFSGDINGNAHLILPYHKSTQLAQSLLRQETILTKLTDLACDALLEIGNIILNSFLGELSNAIGVHLISKLPTLTVGAADQPFLSHQSDEKIILFWTEFGGKAVDAAGFLSVVFEPGSAEIFKCVSCRLFNPDPSAPQ